MMTSAPLLAVKRVQEESVSTLRGASGASVDQDQCSTQLEDSASTLREELAGPTSEMISVRAVCQE